MQALESIEQIIREKRRKEKVAQDEIVPSTNTRKLNFGTFGRATSKRVSIEHPSAGSLGLGQLVKTPSRSDEVPLDQRHLSIPLSLANASKRKEEDVDDLDESIGASRRPRHRP